MVFTKKKYSPPHPPNVVEHIHLWGSLKKTYKSSVFNEEICSQYMKPYYT